VFFTLSVIVSGVLLDGSFDPETGNPKSANCKKYSEKSPMECLECENGFTLVGSGNVQSLNSGFNPFSILKNSIQLIQSTGLNLCTATGKDCKTNEKNCLTCDSQLSCTVCQPGFFLSDKKCLRCPNNCAHCISANTCGTCSAGFFLDQTSKACTACIGGCSKCTGPELCQACEDANYLSEDKKKCTKCTSDLFCKTCASEDTCLECHPMFSMTKDKKKCQFGGYQNGTDMVGLGLSILFSVFAIPICCMNCCCFGGLFWFLNRKKTNVTNPEENKETDIYGSVGSA